jgi:hypothetical protein
MTDARTMSGARDALEGDDFICEYCGCEITVERTGDPAKMPAGSVFTCRCGTVMDLMAASPPDRNAAAPSPTANGS